MTLNNIFNYIQVLGDSHKQIKKTIINNSDEWLSNGNVQYPAMFVQLKTSKLSRINRQVTYTFVCLLSDLANVATFSQINQMDVQSDLTQIAEDVLSLLQFESDKNSDFQASKELNLEYSELLEDDTYGVGFQFDISTKYAANRCQVPTNFISPDAPISPFIMANYSFRNTEDRNSFVVTALRNKQIELLLIDANSPLQVALSATPAIDEFNYNKSTGEFIFGTLIQDLQVIQILNRSI